MDTGDNIPVSGKIDPCGSGKISIHGCITSNDEYVLVSPDTKMEWFGNGMFVLYYNSKQYPINIWKKFWMRVFFGTKFSPQR